MKIAMYKNFKKNPYQRYVVQTYCSWTEPQFETRIAHSLKEVKEIADNVDKVEALYLLGKEISYAKNRNKDLLMDFPKKAVSTNAYQLEGV
jgi:hypothetical protein